MLILPIRWEYQVELKTMNLARAWMVTEVVVPRSGYLIIPTSPKQERPQFHHEWLNTNQQGGDEDVHRHVCRTSFQSVHTKSNWHCHGGSLETKDM